VVTREGFLHNWNIFTNELLKDLDWRNVVAAGGAVLGCLKAKVLEDRKKMEIMKDFQSTAYNASDIDLFIYGLSPQEVSCHSIDPEFESQTNFMILRPRTRCRQLKISGPQPHIATGKENDHED